MGISAVSAVVSMKAIVPVAWVLIGLFSAFQMEGVAVAAPAQEKPAVSATKNASKKTAVAKKPSAKKAVAAKKKSVPPLLPRANPPTRSPRLHCHRPSWT